MSNSEAVDTITRGLEEGSKKPRKPSKSIESRDDAIAYLDAVSELFASIPRPGHQGSRMRACMEALIDVGRIQGGPSNIRTTIDELRTFAGTGKNCLWTALKELKDEGWIHLRRKGYQGTPSVWDIRVPHQYRDQFDLLRDQMSENVCVCRDEFINELRIDIIPTKRHRCRYVPVGHDAFLSASTSRTDYGYTSRVQGLGKSGWIIWRFLESHPGWHTSKEISDATTRSRSTVFKVLKLFIGFGMVEKGRDGIKALNVSMDELDDIARAFNTDGSQADRIRIYRSRRSS